MVNQQPITVHVTNRSVNELFKDVNCFSGTFFKSRTLYARLSRGDDTSKSDDCYHKPLVLGYFRPKCEKAAPIGAALFSLCAFCAVLLVVGATFPSVSFGRVRPTLPAVRYMGQRQNRNFSLQFPESLSKACPRLLLLQRLRASV